MIRPSALPEFFAKARRNPTQAVLEGFHPLKHALRFGASIDLIVTAEGTAVDDTWQHLKIQTVKRELFKELVPVPPESGILAVAKRRVVLGSELMCAPRTEPLVLLEKPSHQGNIGATIRVAAGAGASGVVVIGDTDPWHPVALRGAAGLHFALPVARADSLGAAHGPLIGVDPEGEPLRPDTIPGHAILAFGSESRGLSQELLARVDHRVAIPMQPGVSSLNLATAVAITLYAWKLHDR